MSEATLIDPPVTPYSPIGDLLAWKKTCQEKLAASPGNRDWADALIEVERWIEMAASVQGSNLPKKGK